MAQHNVEQLPTAPKKYRPSRQQRGESGEKGFESKSDAEAEDACRQMMLIRYFCHEVPQQCSFDIDDVRHLLGRIAAAVSPASSVYMRKQRDRIGGHLYELVERNGFPVSTFTLLPRGWTVQAEDLHTVDPRTLIAQLRQMLLRAGAGKVNGWLFCGLHGEHEPNGNAFVFHLHGLASGGMIDVIDSLRKRRGFKGATYGKACRRVRRSRKPLSNLPTPLTYTVQSFWPSRPIIDGDDGSWYRQRDKHRIKEPWHTEVLLWLDRWRLRDTTLMMGMKIGQSGFRTKTYIDEGRW